jgi:CBS-domain-containing membrane protein
MRVDALKPPAGLFLGSFFMIASLGELAAATRLPWLFPSLGPTALMLLAAPLAANSSPRSAVCGHAIGALCGWLALWATGLSDAGVADLRSITHDRVIASALALAATGGMMVIAGVMHPPAGATTLIVALGLITAPADLVIVELAVLILVVEGVLINRLSGVDCPFWSPAEQDRA